jgi:hypothetical protein
MITINLRPGARRAVKRGAAFAGMGGRFKEMTSGVKDPWQMAAMAAWAVVVLGLGFFFITTSAKASSLEPQLVEARAEHDRYQNFLREKRHAIRSSRRSAPFPPSTATASCGRTFSMKSMMPCPTTPGSPK